MPSPTRLAISAIQAKQVARVLQKRKGRGPDGALDAESSAAAIQRRKVLVGRYLHMIVVDLILRSKKYAKTLLWYSNYIMKRQRTRSARFGLLDVQATLFFQGLSLFKAIHKVRKKQN